MKTSRFQISITALSVFLFILLISSCSNDTNLEEKNQNFTSNKIDGDEIDFKTINYKKLFKTKGSATNKISNTISVGGKNVKIYSRNIGEIENHVVFKYGDLINRAISYKQNNPEVQVSIKFAMYKIGDKSYVVFDPNHENYGTVYGTDAAGNSSEKLIFSLVKAARKKVKVDFVYHKDNLDNSNACKANRSNNVLDYLNDKIQSTDSTDTDSPGNKELVSNYLTVNRIDWSYDANEQMHSKFMTVSHYDDGANGKFNTVYVTSSNIDDHIGSIPDEKDWVQTGTLVNNNEGLFNAHNVYFNLIKNNSNSHSAFVSAVRSAHASNSLNYTDANFSAYFFPIPASPNGNYNSSLLDWDTSNANGWDTQYNPFAKYADSLSVSRNGSRYIKGNIYHMKWDNFTRAFRDKLKSEYDNRNVIHTTNFKFLVSTNSNADDNISNNGANGPCKTFLDNYGDGILKLKNEFINSGSFIRNQNSDVIDTSKTSGVKTHSKDMIFAFSEHSRYVSITGTANLKLDAFTSKSNHCLVIKEFSTNHPVYDEFKNIFEYQY